MSWPSGPPHTAAEIVASAKPVAVRKVNSASAIEASAGNLCRLHADSTSATVRLRAASAERDSQMHGVAARTRNLHARAGYGGAVDR
jgi:hypothetical protein